MKKYFIFLFIFIIIFSLTACDMERNQEKEEPLTKVVMVVTEGCSGYISYKDIASQGIERAKKDFKIETEILEAEATVEYINVLSQAAENGADLIIAVGCISSSKLERIAEQYPETAFAMVDSEEDICENVMSLAFKEHEGSFLMGIIAALTTKTDVIGFIGGVPGPTIDKFEYGFRGGVKAINPDAQVLVGYTDTFEDPQLGREMALTQIQQGADIIFHESGQCGNGIIDAASEQEVWVMDVVQDQSANDPKTILCSMFIRVDHAVYFAIQTFMEDDFDGGVYEFGLDFQAVGYIDSYENLTVDVTNQLKAYEAAILAGDIYVPKTREDFEEFTVPIDGLLSQ
ncbi:MAG: BMP family ABC transporter substrate-binding protein [Eubacteriales bacterium]|nr:BMP family ABC transporter substrate-binding protein [Eubacteriales bacterium]